MAHNKSKIIAHSAIIAATYVVLTYIASLLGLSSGVIQVRFSEGLSILPIFTPAAIPGLFIGCLISNILSGCVFWDVVFGSFATLLGAMGTYMFRKHSFLAPIPPIIANTAIVPFVLSYAYGVPGSIWYFMITVGIGEIISCGLFGGLLIVALKKIENRIHW